MTVFDTEYRIVFYIGNYSVLRRTDTCLFDLPHKQVSIYQNAGNLDGGNILKRIIWYVMLYI